LVKREDRSSVVESIEVIHNMSQEYEKETFYYFKYSNKELGIVNNIYDLIV